MHAVVEEYFVNGSLSLGLQCYERCHFQPEALLPRLRPAVYHCVVKDCMPHGLKLLPSKADIQEDPTGGMIVLLFQKMKNLGMQV